MQQTFLTVDMLYTKGTTQVGLQHAIILVLTLHGTERPRRWGHAHADFGICAFSTTQV